VRDRRAAERLQILTQAAATMLGRLAILSRELEPRHSDSADERERMPWKDKQLGRAVASMKERFPEYPTLEGVAEAKSDELRKKPHATAVCRALETWYLCLDDTAVMREDVKALLMELADDLDELPERMRDFGPLAAAYLELFRLHVQITLALAQVPDKEILASMYTYCYQYATDLPVSKFERLSRLLHSVGSSQESALAYLRQEVCDKGPTVQDSVADFVTKLLLGVNESGAAGGQAIINIYHFFVTLLFTIENVLLIYKTLTCVLCVRAQDLHTHEAHAQEPRAHEPHAHAHSADAQSTRTHARVSRHGICMKYSSFSSHPSSSASMRRCRDACNHREEQGRRGQGGGCEDRGGGGKQKHGGQSVRGGVERHGVTCGERCDIVLSNQEARSECFQLSWLSGDVKVKFRGKKKAG
jgi:hypothetical protein